MHQSLPSPTALSYGPHLQMRSLATRCMLRLTPALALAAILHAGPPAPAGVKLDKWSFNLFNPVPREAMREMSTDRPDQTESAYTVDAGHFQIEVDAVSAVFDRRDGVKTTGWGTSWNLKAGLLNNVDLQFVVDPYVTERGEERGAVEKASGFGDVQTRLKINLWGNDGGPTALSIMPFVKWPLPESGLRNGRTEGGVIIPLAIELPAGWSTTLMTEFDFVRNDEGGYDTEFVNSITFAHDIAGHLGGYLEFFSVVGNAPGFDWIGQADVGFTYALNDNAVLDFGCNFGVSKAAPDFNPFVGFSVRF